MREIIVERSQPRFTWIDVTDPSAVELAALEKEFRLHPITLRECLDPTHLPKIERLGNLTFMIVRGFDAAAPPDGDNMRELTRKVALFVGDSVLVTVHRKPQPYLEEVRRKAAADVASAQPAAAVTAALLEAVIQSFVPALQAAEDAADRLEEQLFESAEPAEFMREVYTIKRRATVVRWTMRHTAEVIGRFPAGDLAPVFQDLKETADHHYFTADQLIDDANQLLTLQLSVAAHKTNEVMTVLTILSVFFMPLTFIVGIYGMNFEFMPEIHSWGRWGYPFSWVLMLAVTLGTAIWFKRKGWVK